ncbi:galactose-1-phosphate uridylyltransferase [bacterium]|nr:galactose-1-phosphate uridylyltransferase [bacterium]|tara:strand:+ start:2482 stop:3513 length:1032 start_codon:yes stop_codon:yes gene_type:complete
MSLKRKIKRKKKRPISELRQDLVTNAWVVIATGRAKRPEMFANEKRAQMHVSEKNCPFCAPNISRQHKPTLVYENENKTWSLMVIPNKYPAFKSNGGLGKKQKGPFIVKSGVGFHEVVVLGDHKKPLAKLQELAMAELLDSFQERYLSLMNRRFINYISIFHNHGREAGASVAHPHCQIIAIPVIDPDIQRSLNGSMEYFKSNKQCVHCVMLDWESEQKQRVVFENNEFIAVCPFVSRVAFEIIVYPKEHKPYFERINAQEKLELAQALLISLKALFKGLKDPAFNLFLHTSPCDGKAHDHYHWHFIIMPKTSIWAGFELGTGIEISTIEPEKAGRFLRKQIK